LDKAIFPTSGGQQRLSALIAVPGLDLSFYKISAKDQHYFPLAKDLVLRLLIEGAYGDGISGTNNLPFFENFFAGGVNSVRGFEDNTLGPVDSNGDPLGGNVKLVGSAELLFPVPFFEELKSVRLGAFFDAGMVSDSFSLGDLRYSVGISGQWLSPFGALAVSAAVPISKKSNDRVQTFQFTFGSGF
jgi:outer membrane protein insertion porin family